MFNGIVEEIGKVINLKKIGSVYRLSVKGAIVSQDAKIGDSICVNGVCLTIVECNGGYISFDIIPETIRRTNLKDLRVNDIVNLERSLRFNDRMDGHFVTGHIDAVGRIEKRYLIKDDVCLTVSLQPAIMSYIAPKGSVAVDGVSLTVGEVKANKFCVYLIPHTLKVTNLGRKSIGDTVNIEVDILARYVRQRH